MKGLGNDYKMTEASTTNDYVKLPAGGYVCRILKVEDVPGDKPYLRIVYDINEGDYKGYYSDDWGKNNEWAHENRHYYTPASFGMFKGFLKAIDESNGTGYEAAAETGFDENRMAGLLIGYIIGEEEYEGNDGSIKTRLRVRSVRTVQDIRDGKYREPELKKLAVKEKPLEEPAFGPVKTDDLPF